MESEQFITKKEKKSFREIVLEHLSKILEISRSEFRGGYRRLVVQGNYSFEEYVPDNRKGYIQAVESLADILSPFFDEEMEEDKKNIYEDIEGLFDKSIERKEKILKDNFAFEVKKAKAKSTYPPEEIELEEALREARGGNVIGKAEEQRITRSKLRLIKEFFRCLNHLLHRSDYLKSAIYSEIEEELEEEEPKEIENPKKKRAKKTPKKKPKRKPKKK